MTEHPEQKNDEVFLGNWTVGSKLPAVPSVRLGIQAYDVYGKELLGGHRPLFIKRVDLPIYEAIRTEEMKQIRYGKK